MTIDTHSLSAETLSRLSQRMQPLLDKLDKERQQRLIAQRLTIAPDDSLFEYTNSLNLLATIDRYQPLCRELGIEMLCYQQVPETTITQTIDGIEFALRPIDSGRLAVPATVYHRYRKAQEFSLPIRAWLLGEEQFKAPVFVIDETLSEITPLAKGAVPRGHFRPVPPVPPPPSGPGTPTQRPSTQTRVPGTTTTFFPEPPKLDPILIGVLPVTRRAGIWCVFGRWWH